MIGEYGKVSEWVTEEQEDGHEWVIGEQGERSGWVTENRGKGITE